MVQTNEGELRGLGRLLRFQTKASLKLASGSIRAREGLGRRFNGDSKLAVADSRGGASYRPLQAIEGAALVRKIETGLENAVGGCRENRETLS